MAGRLLDVFGFPYDTARGGPFLPGEYLTPAGLIVGPDGTIYWTETNPANGYMQVQRFVFTGDGKLPLGDGDDRRHHHRVRVCSARPIRPRAADRCSLRRSRCAAR